MTVLIALAFVILVFTLFGYVGLVWFLGEVFRFPYGPEIGVFLWLIMWVIIIWRALKM